MRMAKEIKSGEKRDVSYETVRLSDLRVGRRGKHHELLTGILKNLESLPISSALVVPLHDIGKVSLANLRSAVARAGKAHGLSLVTYSDEKNFYIWKRSGLRAKPPGAGKHRR
jgi:hypothetical protein